MIVYLHPLMPFLSVHWNNTKIFDLVAQLVEHLPFKEWVLGSSPSQVTIKRKIHQLWWIFCFVETPNLFECFIKT